MGQEKFQNFSKSFCVFVLYLSYISKVGGGGFLKKQRMISIFIFIIAVGLIGYVVQTTQSTQIGIEEGKLAPDFTLPLWNKNEEASLSSFRGKIVVLNLWASWCPPCRQEMPEFIRLYENYKDKGVHVLGVNLATHERDASGVDEFMEYFGVPFPTFVDQPIDEVNQRGVVSTLYNINSIPYTYILDENGKIVHIIQGATTYDMLEKLIKNLL